MKPRKRTLKNGTVVWDARWIDAHGKERSKTERTEKQAILTAAKMTIAVSEGTYTDPIDGKTTVHRLAEQWRDSAATEGTARVRNGLIPNLGPLAGVQIGKLKPPAIRAWYAELGTGRTWMPGHPPLADSTRRNLLSQLSAMLNQAVADELIPRNPAKRVHPGPSPSSQVMPEDLPTAAQIQQLITTKFSGGKRKYYPDPEGRVNDDGSPLLRRRHVQKSPPMAIAIRVLAATGMRVSECAGLTWSRVNFEQSTITVDRQAHRSRREELIPLKTGVKGRRVLKVDPQTMGELQWLRDQGLHSERCFVTARGTPVGFKDIHHAIVSTADYLGFEVEITPKTLRHFHASVLLSAGVSVKTVQHRLGHSTAMQTLDTYAHVMPGDDGAAADIFAARVLEGVRPNLRAVGGG